MISEKQNLSLQLDLQWQDDFVRYKDRYFLLKTNFWRDIYPAVLDFQIKRAKLGDTMHINYAPGDLFEEEYQQNNIKTIPLKTFNQHYRGHIPIQPVLGRFYPKGMIEGVAGCFKMDSRPFRIIDKTATTLTVDLNHPLANVPLELTATITDVFDANQQNGGRCNDIAELVTADGPGIQRLMADKTTDFFQGMPFLRKMNDDDALFYNAINTAPPVDKVAIEQLKTFYEQYLSSGQTVLELLSGMDSYIPEHIKPVNLTGLGLKEQDLQSNSDLNQFVIQDLNQKPQLPFENEQFDAVLCAFGIEYLIHPVVIFKQVAWILKPGGRFLVSFSNRFFDKKVIALWDDIHEFERMGLVLEYFRQSGEFEDLYCESMRGMIRQNDDPFPAKNVFSCPMFMLSGKKISVKR